MSECSFCGEVMNAIGVSETVFNVLMDSHEECMNKMREQIGAALRNLEEKGLEGYKAMSSVMGQAAAYGTCGWTPRQQMTFMWHVAEMYFFGGPMADRLDALTSEAATLRKRVEVLEAENAELLAKIKRYEALEWAADRMERSGPDGWSMNKHPGNLFWYGTRRSDGRHIDMVSALRAFEALAESSAIGEGNAINT